MIRAVKSKLKSKRTSQSTRSQMNTKEIKRWKRKAYEAGSRYGSRFEKETGGFEPAKSAMNHEWNKWASRLPRAISTTLYHSAARKFFKGFYSEIGEKYTRLVPLPTDKKVAAIISVKNEDDTISKVLDELECLPFHEVIVVVNGSNDKSFERIREHRAAPIVLHYEEALGHDVGRSIGANVSQSDILLFLDGDIRISYKKLIPFIHAVDKGTDVALNDISPFIHKLGSRDAVSVVKEFVNRAMGRADLMANSMTAIPHALSRSAVETIGLANLSVPPLAQVIAMKKKLKVKASASINVLNSNRRSGLNHGRHNPLTQLIIGDHLEALHKVMSRRGKRLSFKDNMRKRHLAGG